jgi:thiol-disulfide isomerase/thioredoxin
MPFRRIRTTVLALLLLGPASAGAQGARSVANTPAPAPITSVANDEHLRPELMRGRLANHLVGGGSRPADLESAIARVRSLYFAHDFHHGAAEGDAALARWPESSELAMWTVANMAGPSGLRRGGASILRREAATAAEEALARAESLVTSGPDDVWSAIALALALTHHRDRRTEALDASVRPLELAPTLPEAVWVRGIVLHDRRQYREVVTLIEEKWPVVERQWAELLILEGNAWLAMDSEAPERLAEGLEILARVREQYPENVNAHFLAGTALGRDRRRLEESAALLQRAAALSPGSADIAGRHWREISSTPGLDAEDRKALISTAASELLQRRGQYPGVLRQVANDLVLLGLEAEGAELQDRVLTEFAHTADAEYVLSPRWGVRWLRLLSGRVEDTMVARAELSSMLWSFIDRPVHHQPELLGNAYRILFDQMRREETASPDTLLLLARGAVEHARFLVHPELAVGLAGRGVHMEAAREIARDGIDAAEAHVAKRVENFGTPGAAADFLDRSVAKAYAAIGYVELKAGDLLAAREAIDRALELKPDNAQVQFRAGALAEAEGDLDAAEIHYAWGERQERLDPYSDKTNLAALERIYSRRYGSVESYEDFIAVIEERDRGRRWQRIADSRIKEPRDLPAIDLEWLDSGRIGADELAGRIVVINFWGVWCGPCVAEAPQLQKLHEKYRDDPSVVFLTINAFDPDLHKVRTWLADNEYDYPVLVDDNFVTRHEVRSYPTTWFTDRDGRIAFEHVGISAAVFEEFVWRVEMLQAEAGVRVEAGCQAVAAEVHPPADLESAISRVRSLYFGRDFHHGAAEGDAALERWPESSELAAWTIANLARTRIMPVMSAYSSAAAEEAVARAESLVESRPDDVWAAIALALALTSHNDRRGEALAASLRPLELAPTMPEAVWARGFVLHDHRQYRAVASLIAEKWPVLDRQWAELLTIQGNALLRMEEGPERRAEGLEVLARTRELEPENVNAHYLAGSALLWDRRTDEAASLLARAAALSPGSPGIVTFHWRAIQADPGLDAEEKKALISASAGELLELRGQYPGTLRDVATGLGLWGLPAEAAELQDRVVTEFAHTVEAEWVLASRWERLSLRLLQGQAEDPVSAGAELSSMLWSFIERPHHQQTELLGNTYRRLFDQALRDAMVSPDTLLLLARGAAEHNRFLPNPELAIGLAERGVHLDAARQIARDGIGAAEEHVARRMEMYDTPGEAADALDRALADAWAAIAYVELKSGDPAAARAAINRALELKPDNLQVQLRAGLLAEAEGDLEAAEIHYAWGEREERLRAQLLPGLGTPNRDALERIHTGRNGSMEGYDAFIAGIEERDRARRWQRIADSRIEEPRDLPAIDLAWLDGGRIGADSLEGRVVVINFWGIWCGPCVAEAPQIQQFHEKYRDDPGVVFLTINVFDYDLDRVRSWMAENGYDYPVLVDDNFATRWGVSGYPTTWFVDADGRIMFEYSGASAAMYEEFVWRVEMLQDAGVSTDAAAAEPSADREGAIARVRSLFLDRDFYHRAAASNAAIAP